MPFSSTTLKSDTLFVLFGLAFVVFGWFAFLLTLGSFFLFPLILCGAIVTGALALWSGALLLIRAPLDVRIAFVIALSVAALIGYVSEPTVFSGRDQGSIAEAAFRLAHNTQLAFSSDASASFFKIYGEGAALNFPGFAYTAAGDLITQFPLGYTSWLASFIALFGLLGPAIGNALLLFLSFLTLYSLLRLFAHSYYAFAGLALAATSFLPTWFAKITLSENFAAFLFLFLALNLVLLLQRENSEEHPEETYLPYAGVLLSATLLAFTRIEGFAFLALALIILFCSQSGRNIWKTHLWTSLILPGILFVFFFLRDFFINLPYYKIIGKALIKFLDQLGAGSVTGDLASTGSSFTLGSVFFLYGLLFLCAFGLFGILLALKEKRYILLLPAAIALPTFVYLFDPNISLDHPWMLRRYLFSLYPTLLFSAVIGIALLFARDSTLPIAKPEGGRLFAASVIFFVLIALQYPSFALGLPFAEHRMLAGQIAAFSQTFAATDLVLVDRNATGSGFAMLTGPAQFLFGKNMVYFFNPYDLERLDTTLFTQTFLLVPEGDQARYAAVFGDRLTLAKTVTFSDEQFETLSLEDGSALRLPEKVSRETRNLLFRIR
ncbi:MAG: hypothetical protein A3E38_02380 [Candidatus Moranbacteria bacterium RIFCSPHIGHO2_12_FULL_54_9]|nr:MAG: hypothetical protein A2878_02860 [Candidatus Moranbacteria bacterium RIFCSPHIGHO2_01_FULL_54_31]OGI26074.1 MAG: hypothetical protein A3E38_02380 [Candidatus Moranbacteria bacterium RIFCSPHIGHO2_12_FULL_54_9]